MSASAARQIANAANAQLSTGPKTPEGKAQSSQNARKHCLTAAQLIFGPEDREEFEAMLADFQSDVAPQGAIQQTLFDELVASAWKLRRILRMETELCAHATNFHDLLHDDDLQIRLDRLARHKARIERTFHRSLKELKALQTTQAVSALLAPEIRAAAPPLASAIQITKRTQPAESQALFMGPPDAVDLEWIAPPGPGAAAHNLTPSLCHLGSPNPESFPGLFRHFERKCSPFTGVQPGRGPRLNAAP